MQEELKEQILLAADQYEQSIYTRGDSIADVGEVKNAFADGVTSEIAASIRRDACIAVAEWIKTTNIYFAELGHGNSGFYRKTQGADTFVATHAGTLYDEFIKETGRE